MRITKQQKAITLVALVITIIILLILAGISISTLTNQGLFRKADEAKTRTEEKTIEENEILQTYTGEIDNLLPAKNITEAQSNNMLTKTVNSSIQDDFGNKITVPAGFKIKADSTTNNATTVDKGIVIVDKDNNEFVWIPVGKIYTDAKKTDSKSKTIELNRYTFDEEGKPTSHGSDVINDYHQELAESTYGNITAKNINDFKTKASVARSGGFYIGRYEARTELERTSKNDDIKAISENGSQYVYNFVNQSQAANLSRNMYKNATTFTSDLVNSYAWDTATLFLQTFGKNKKYSIQTSLNTEELAKKGTNNETTIDVQCNVYDMASNAMEWSTETSTYFNSFENFYHSCTYRGGSYSSTGCKTGLHFMAYSNTYSVKGITFRPILYL